MYRSSLLLTGAILVSLSGCNTNKGSISQDFGNSVQHNMAAQIINPRVPNPRAQAPGMDGARAFKAIDRYQRDDVEQLNPESTSNKAVSSGGKK